MLSRNLHRLALVPLLLALLLKATLTAAQTDDLESQTIWFFGNSYTSYHGLNRRFACFYLRYWARGNGIDAVHAPRNSPGGWRLANHADWLRTDPDAPSFFEGLNYPWVVLQEQSLSAGTEVSLVASASLGYYLWLTPVENIMFLMTWGRRDGVTNCDFPCHTQRILEGYKEMAVASGVGTNYIAPCGLVWEKVYDECVERNVDPLDEAVCLFPKLYWDGAGHPSELGTYACAATITVAMTGADPRGWGCRPNYDEDEVPPVDAADGAYMLDVVAQVIEETFTSGLITYPFDALSWETDPPGPPTSPAPTDAPPPATPAPTNAPPPATPAPTNAPPPATPQPTNAPPPATPQPTNAPPPPATPQPTSSPTRGTAMVTMTIPPQPQPTMNTTFGMNSTLGTNATLNYTDGFIMTESPTAADTDVATAVDKSGANIWTRTSQLEPEDTMAEEDMMMASEGGDALFGQGSSGTSWLLTAWFAVGLGNVVAALMLLA